jgi:hypothetical protein
MAKRSYEIAFDEEDTLQIKLADEEGRGPLQAQLLVLLPMSQCVRSLPDKTEWDLSSLLINGQPVNRSTVVSWLNRVYNHLRGCDYEAQEVQPSATSLYQLLVFADAVGSEKVLLKACVSAHAETSRFVLKLGQKEVQLSVNGMYYFASQTDQQPLKLYGRVPPRSSGPLVTVQVGTAASLRERSAFMSQLAAQVEQLLFIAYKLQLDQLLEKVTKFFQSSTLFGAGHSVLGGFQGTIVSQRVMDAAAGSPDGKTALINHLTQVPCSSMEREPHSTHVHEINIRELLKPVNLPADANKLLRYTARLTEAAFGMPAGALVEVESSHFGNTIMIVGVGTFLEHKCIGPW